MRRGDLANKDHVVFDDDDGVFAGEREKKLAGLVVSVSVMPAAGSSTRSSLRVLGEQHSDLSHCFWPWAECRLSRQPFP